MPYDGAIKISSQEDLTPYYHEVDVNPGLVFVKAKEVVFIKEKWSIATSVNTEFIKSTTKLSRAELELIRDAYFLVRKHNDTIAHMKNMVDIEIRGLAEVIQKLRKSELFYDLTISPRGEEYHVPPASYMLRDHNEISAIMTRLREDRVETMPGDRPNTCMIENDYALESFDIQKKFDMLHAKVAKLPYGEYKIESNFEFMSKTLYLLYETIGKAKQLALSLCDLLSHQKVLFTSAALNKYLIQIRDSRQLALPFFISNFGSILLGEMVQVHIVSVKNELFMEMIIPFTDKDLFLLYEMQPFPVFQTHLKDKTVAAYIKPRAEYIAVGDSSDRYLFLNQTDLSKCNERNTFFLCENEFYFEFDCVIFNFRKERRNVFKE